MSKTTRSTRALLAAFAALGGFLSLANAQSVATAPVGAVSTAVPVGVSSLGVSLLNPNLVVATCSANTATNLTLTGVTGVGSLLTATDPYYVEATSGPLEGERFDVDVASTISGPGNQVFIATSANNTFALAADNAIGTQFALRKHVTVAQVGSSFTTALVANNNVNNADQIRIFNASTGNFTTYYLRNTPAGEWRLQGASSGSSNNVVIPAGTGVLIKKGTAPATFVSTGAVRTNDFSMPMNVGLSFVAPAYPIGFSPASLGGTATNGWTANNNSNLADQLRVYNVTTGVFNSYYLRTSPVDEWRPVGGATGSGVTSTTLFNPDAAILLSRKSADTNYILVSPVSL